jgi:predicted enzyme related to lactoylglutathione lyase
MSKVRIIVPVEDDDDTEAYYRDVMSFDFDGDLFYLPINDLNVALRLLNTDAEAKVRFPPRKCFPLFAFSIESDFLSYCDSIWKKGARIERVVATPGGYHARISDPSGNQFEVECDSFSESDPSIDTSKSLSQ